MRSAITGVSLLLMSCLTPPRPATDVSESARQCHSGTVGLMSGVEPQPVLTVADRRLVLIAGGQTVPVALEGATIEVCGATQFAEGSRIGRLTVDSFDLRSIDGRPAVLGRLVVGGNGLMLVKADGTSWRLEGAVAGLRDKGGERLWVAGAISEQSIQVTSYGFLPGAPAPRSPMHF